MKAEYKKFILRQSSERRRLQEERTVHDQLDTVFKMQQLDEEFGTQRIGDQKENGEVYSAKDVVDDFRSKLDKENSLYSNRTDWELLQDMLWRATKVTMYRKDEMEIAGLWGQLYGVSHKK